VALRNLLVSKFRNKYFAQDSDKDELNVYIESEMEKLFQKEVIEQSEITVIDKKIKE
jgi:hypothetical protein